ncbi:hypothetical protein BG454_14885 [Roseinatronobacter bogoriensis subsp. barguzinensis]|uniref:Uncharacterized protein n=2 Tax=Roseinatronobacter bogoriensis TaxID=119542 RepID=A0A2K8KG37_9RHOB|nr:hypothetical protein BG454_14885 [Rhodobaca barguzinensis]
MASKKRNQADQLTARLKKIITDEYNDCDINRDVALSAAIRLMLTLHMERCGIIPTIDMLRDLADVVEADVFRGPLQ